MRPGVVVALLVSMALSGCLAHDLWREPFMWSEVAAAGENVDAAQAFGTAFGDLPERVGDDLGDQAIGRAEDLPDTVYFQNLKEFIERQAPGRGDELEDNVRMVTTTAGNGYRNLTGQVADAWESGTGDFAAPSVAVPFEVPDRTTRLRLSIDVALARPSDESGTNPSPANNVEIRLFDARGGERAHHVIDTTRHIDDLYFVGTYGDANEVRQDLAGTWRLDVSATGEGAWSVVVEAYHPTYDDYRWWQFWKADAREAA